MFASKAYSTTRVGRGDKGVSDAGGRASGSIDGESKGGREAAAGDRLTKREDREKGPWLL